jgi:molecular chaperone GrpE
MFVLHLLFLYIVCLKKQKKSIYTNKAIHKPFFNILTLKAENMKNTQNTTQHNENSNVSDNDTINLDNMHNNIQNTSNVEMPIDELTAAQNQASEYQELYIRAKADFENAKKRHNEDLDKMRKFAVERFAENLLPVMDSLQAIVADKSGNIDSMKQGVELTIKQLISTFEKQQIVEVNPVNEMLNPAYHQAISSVAHAAAQNTVVQVMQKGYKISDRLLRPALVIVSTGENV